MPSSTILKGCLFYLPRPSEDWDAEDREELIASIKELGGGVSRDEAKYGHIIVVASLWTTEELDTMIAEREKPERVVLSHEWVAACKDAGRYMGEAHAWAGSCLAAPGEGAKRWKGYEEEMEIREMEKYGVPARLAAAGPGGSVAVPVCSFRGASSASHSDAASRDARRFEEPQPDWVRRAGPTHARASTGVPPRPAGLPPGPPKRRWHNTPASKPPTTIASASSIIRKSKDPRLIAKTKHQPRRVGFVLADARRLTTMPPPPVPIRPRPAPTPTLPFTLTASLQPESPSPRSAADASARRMREAGPSPSPEPESQGPGPRPGSPRVRTMLEKHALPKISLHPPTPPTTPPRVTVPLGREGRGGLFV